MVKLGINISHSLQRLFLTYLDFDFHLIQCSIHHEKSKLHSLKKLLGRIFRFLHHLNFQLLALLVLFIFRFETNLNFSQYKLLQSPNLQIRRFLKQQEQSTIHLIFNLLYNSLIL